jgi:hypothetical protein
MGDYFIDTDELKGLRLKLHLECMADPIYKEGYNADNHFNPPFIENPYLFPREDGINLTKLSIKPILSDEDMINLVKLKNIVDQSEWSRWSKGNYARHCSKL